MDGKRTVMRLQDTASPCMAATLERDRSRLARFVMVLMLALAGVLVSPAVRADPVEVVNIRFGHYPDRTRIVLDMKAPLPYRIEPSADGRTLAVVLPAVKWTPPPSRPLAKMEPLLSYQFHPGPRPNESRVVFTAGQPLKVLLTQTFLPDHDHTTHRIMVELAAYTGGGKPPAPPPAAPVAAVSPPAAAPAAPSPVKPASPAVVAAIPLPVKTAPVVVSPPAAPALAPVASSPPPVAPAPAAASAPVRPVTPAPAKPIDQASLKPAEQALEQGGRAILDHQDYPDYAGAIRWFRKSAALGNAQAAFNIGELYRTGKGVPQDMPTAASWYEKASQSKLAPAQFLLGVLFYNGTGVAQDRVRARELLKQAAAQNYDPARQALEEIRTTEGGAPH